MLPLPKEILRPFDAIMEKKSVPKTNEDIYKTSA
jgi:hypothetical protein